LGILGALRPAAAGLRPADAVSDGAAEALRYSIKGCGGGTRFGFAQDGL